MEKIACSEGGPMYCLMSALVNINDLKVNLEIISTRQERSQTVGESKKNTQLYLLHISSLYHHYNMSVINISTVTIVT